MGPCQQDRRRRPRSKGGQQCTFCGKVFPIYAHLMIHMNVHTKERPYECNQCSANFCYYSTMHNHKKRVHRRNELGAMTTDQPPRQASPVDTYMESKEEWQSSSRASPSFKVANLEKLVEVIALPKCKVVLPKLVNTQTGSKEEAEAEVEIAGDAGDMMEREGEVIVINGSADISHCSSIKMEENIKRMEEPEKPDVGNKFSCELCACCFLKERKLASHIYSAHRITAMFLNQRMMMPKWTDNFSSVTTGVSSLFNGSNV